MRYITKKNGLIFIMAATLIFALYRLLLPVTIIGVHHSPRETGYSSLLVKNFPIIKTRKIAWWEKNQAMLKERYNIPLPYRDGTYNVTIWNFGDGYKEMPYNAQELDLMCFDDMDTKVNCIEKNSLLSIRKNTDGSIYYY